MSGFAKRITLADGVPTLTASGVSVADATRRLESGESPATVLGAAPLDLVALLGVLGLGDDASLGPALAQTRPGRPRLLQAASEPALAELWPHAPRRARLALAAALLQILDFWEESHDAAQEADDQGERRFSAYWHGVAHRREPDPGNASYWFRRVGPHPLFPALAEAATRMINAGEDVDDDARAVVARGWDPFAMIDLCTSARRDAHRERLARRLQRIELAMLLETTAVEVADEASAD